jgi:tetratricopeptide (TPR) repeat protein
MVDEQSAESFYLKGIELKNSGNPEAALTEFRRAVLADPTHFNSQLEVGLLCRSKAAVDPVLMRLAFESFKQAARLNLQHQEVHDNYIMLSQKLGRLDELLIEYENLVKQHPENELLARCKKNILTISMAMMPDKVNIAGGQMSSGMQKLVLFSSIGLIVTGIGMALVPVFLKTAGSKPAGITSITLILVGISGLVLWTRLK